MNTHVHAEDYINLKKSVERCSNRLITSGTQKMRGRWNKDNGVGNGGREIRERASQKRKETIKKMTIFRD